VSLWCSGEVTGNHSCIRLACCARTSPFFTTMLGPNCHPGWLLVRAQVVDHPSYILDLEPSNLLVHLIGLFKKRLHIKGFATDADAKQAVTSWLQIYSTPGYKLLCHGGTNANVDTVEVWCVPSATHVPSIHQSRNKFLGISVCCLILLKELFVSHYLLQNLVPCLPNYSLSQHMTQPVAEGPRYISCWRVISELRLVQTFECCAKNEDVNVREQYT